MALSSASSRSNSRGRPGLRGPAEGVTDLSMGGIIGRDHFLIKSENNDLRSVCGCRGGGEPALQGNQERGKRRNSDCSGPGIRTQPMPTGLKRFRVIAGLEVFDSTVLLKNSLIESGSRAIWSAWTRGNARPGRAACTTGLNVRRVFAIRRTYGLPFVLGKRTRRACGRASQLRVTYAMAASVPKAVIT